MGKKYLENQALIFEKINEAIPNTVYIFDLDEKVIVWLNKAGQALAGYSTEEIRSLGHEYYEKFMHPEDIPFLEKLVHDCHALRDGDTVLAEYRVRDRQGQFHWVQDRVTVFSRNENGSVESILGVVTAIDEIKARENVLRQTVKKLNMSLNAARMGTWEWDIEKNKLLWDERMYQIHDMDPAKVTSPLEEVWNRADRQDMELANIRIQEAATKKEDFYVTYRVKFRNDEIHHIRCYGGAITVGETQWMYGVAWDSTEEILTELEIAEAKARLISSTKMAALGEMSGGIAHEINNPLTVIQARSFQLLQMVEAGQLDAAKIKQVSESISRTADKIAKIIKSLRSFAREGSQDPFEIVPVKKIVEETLEFCRTRFYNHGVEIELGDMDPDLEVECRVIQIEQVLLNLLNNSFDAIQNLEEKWIRVCVENHNNKVQILVKDSGKGIDGDIQDQIMLPFFTTKEVGKGTGLGLSISSGIIRHHKGSLHLDPKAENTTFVIELPHFQDGD